MSYLESQDLVTFAHTSCQIMGVETQSGTFKPLKNTYLNAPYDFSGDLSNTIGSSYTISNPAHSTIGLHIDGPTGMTFGFFGSFDGANYAPITFRQIGDDGYTQVTTTGADIAVNHDYIGSVAGLRNIRFTTLTTGIQGSLSGFVAGRLSINPSVLEGIEHSSPPHKFGNPLFHKGFTATDTTISHSGIVQGITDKRIVITFISFGAISTAGANVTIYEGSGDSYALNPDNWAFSTYVKTSNTQTEFFNMSLPTPFICSEKNTPISIVSDADVTLRGVIHGYLT